MPSEHRDAKSAIVDRVPAAFLLGGLAERRDAVAHRLDPRERRAAVGKGPQQQEERQQPAGVLGVAADLVVRAAGQEGLVGEEELRAGPGEHHVDEDDEAVGRDGEGAAALLDAAQVHEHQQDDEEDVSATACLAATGRRAGDGGDPAATQTVTVST